MIISVRHINIILGYAIRKVRWSSLKGVRTLANTAAEFTSGEETWYKEARNIRTVIPGGYEYQRRGKREIIFRNNSRANSIGTEDLVRTQTLPAAWLIREYDSQCKLGKLCNTRDTSWLSVVNTFLPPFPPVWKPLFSPPNAPSKPRRASTGLKGHSAGPSDVPSPTFSTTTPQIIVLSSGDRTSACILRETIVSVPPFAFASPLCLFLCSASCFEPPPFIPLHLRDITAV